MLYKVSFVRCTATSRPRTVRGVFYGASGRICPPKADPPPEETCVLVCRRRDSNSHGFPHQVLNLARLPISPLRLSSVPILPLQQKLCYFFHTPAMDATEAKNALEQAFLDYETEMQRLIREYQAAIERIAQQVERERLAELKKKIATF